MRERLLIYGAGGLGREVLSCIKVLDKWDIIGFLDDTIPAGSIVKGLPVLGGHQTLGQHSSPINVILALGDPQVKKKIRSQIHSPYVKFPVVIHPSVVIQDPFSVSCGEGSFIGAGCVLTTDIVIHQHVLINISSTIGHDASIGSFTSVMPGVNISGNVQVGEGVLIGSGACIRNKVSIGENARVGMGAVVLNDVQRDVTVAGVPAKILNV